MGIGKHKWRSKDPIFTQSLGGKKYCDKNHMWLLVNSRAKESNLWFKVTKVLHALKANCTQIQSWVAFFHVMEVEKHNCIVSSDWTCVFYVNIVMSFCFWSCLFLKMNRVTCVIAMHAIKGSWKHWNMKPLINKQNENMLMMYMGITTWVLRLVWLLL